jgi:acyl-CoA synthetase (AMP-forming)/AMP-acid ligase II
MIRAAAERWPEVVAVKDDGRQITFAELKDLMMAAASGFVAAGLQMGDRVVLWIPNSLEWIVACLGVQAAGGVMVPLNTRFKGAEAQYILNKSRARYLAIVDTFLGQSYPQLLEGYELPHLARTIRVRSPEARIDDWERFVDAATPEDHAEAARPARARTSPTLCLRPGRRGIRKAPSQPTSRTCEPIAATARRRACAGATVISSFGRSSTARATSRAGWSPAWSVRRPSPNRSWTSPA